MFSYIFPRTFSNFSNFSIGTDVFTDTEVLNIEQMIGQQGVDELLNMQQEPNSPHPGPSGYQRPTREPRLSIFKL